MSTGLVKPPPFHCAFANIKYQVVKYDQDPLNFKLNELKFGLFVLSFKIRFFKFGKSPSVAPYAGHIRLQRDATP